MQHLFFKPYHGQCHFGIIHQAFSSHLFLLLDARPWCERASEVPSKEQVRVCLWLTKG